MAIFFSNFDFPLKAVSRHSENEHLVGCEALRMGDPGHFCSKSFDMRLFPLQNIFRNEHWKGAVLDADALYLLVEKLLYFFPDKERCRLFMVSVSLPPCGFSSINLQYIAA